MEYWGRAWADYCDISYIASSASDVSALSVCIALHPQITRRQFSVVPMLIWMSQNSSTFSPSVVFDSHRHIGKLPGQLQCHCLSRLNPFIPCVCAFIYLSSFTADMSSSSHPCCSVECSCKSHMWARQYTWIHGAFQDVHRSQKPGSNKRGVNGTYIDRYIQCR